MNSLGVVLTPYMLGYLSLTRRAICTGVCRAWCAAARTLPFPVLRVFAFAGNPLRRCFLLAEKAVPFGLFIQMWARNGAPLPFPLRFVTRLSVFQSGFSGFQLSALSQAMLRMPLLETVHVLAGPSDKDTGAMAEHAWVAGGFFPDWVRSLHFMTGYVTRKDAPFARHIALVVLAHRHVRNVTVHVKVYRPKEPVVAFVRALCRELQDLREPCVCRTGTMFADAAGWPAELGVLLAAFACTHNPPPNHTHTLWVGHRRASAADARVPQRSPLPERQAGPRARGRAREGGAKGRG